MIETPQYVKEALVARHPAVGCHYSMERQRFRLIVYWNGRHGTLRWLEGPRGEFVWPDLYNTIDWLNKRDSWGSESAQAQKLMLDALNAKRSLRDRVRRAKLSDMVKCEMAPHVKWALKKDGVI